MTTFHMKNQNPAASNLADGRALKVPMSELLRAFWTVASDRDGEAAKRQSLSSPSQSLWVSHFAKRYLKKNNLWLLTAQVSHRPR